MSAAAEPEPEPQAGGLIPADPLAEGGRIVVGVDDSEHAAAALRWALREAVLRRATVEAVHAWSPPVTVLPFGVTLKLPVDDGDIDAAARDELNKIVDAAVEELSGEPPEVLRTVMPGPAAAVLLDLAAAADLLVLGSQGRTGLRQLALGSVAHACVQHAACPVVVVRSSEGG